MKRIFPELSLALVAGLALAGNTGEEQTPTFEELDANEDQRISSMEARSHRDIAAAFAKADSNKDGYLTRAEFEEIS